jgi:2-oxoglutarate ferredoxin oxidoreductase subunit gamma
MNLPSLEKFESHVVKDGNLFINKSLIEKEAKRDDINAYYVPANEIAQELGNAKVANMVMLGAYLEVTKIIKPQTIIDAFTKVFGEDKATLIPLNEEALKKGAEFVKK